MPSLQPMPSSAIWAIHTEENRSGSGTDLANQCCVPELTMRGTAFRLSRITTTTYGSRLTRDIWSVLLTVPAYGFARRRSHPLTLPWQTGGLNANKTYNDFRKCHNSREFSDVIDFLGLRRLV